MTAKETVSGAQHHPILKLLDPSSVPKHVAIIMDGNGRWATARGLARIEGHKAGIEAVRRAVKASSEAGVSCLTLYAFSIENWKRPKYEVDALFRLLNGFLKAELSTLIENKVKFRTIGRLEDLPAKSRKLLRDVKEKTKDGEWTLTLALSYGGRSEIADACDALVREARGKEAGRITEADVAKHLYAPDLPDPDLLIRTSGEHRISNFLLWQIAYAEMVILDVLWPDFAEEDFYEALLDYQRRERRYGGVPQAVTSGNREGEE